MAAFAQALADLIMQFARERAGTHACCVSLGNAQHEANRIWPNTRPGGGIAGDAMGLGAGVAMGQVLAQQLTQGLQGGAGAATAAAAAAATAAAQGVKPEEVMALLEKLGELKTKGILTDEEFTAWVDPKKMIG